MKTHGGSGITRDSILSNAKECYVKGCGCTENLHRHHVYEGPARTASEENGFWCWLCPYHHNMSPRSVHMDERINLALKQHCQRKFEQTHSREEFMAIIHKNYL